MAIQALTRSVGASTCAAILSILALSCSGAVASRAPQDFVGLEMLVTLDQVSVAQAATGHRKVGDVDRLRLVFDAAALDRQTRRVSLLNFQHLTQGEYRPSTPDAIAMPMTDAWLDMARQPYRLHFHAAVTHGTRILIDVDETSGRLIIRPQNRPQDVEIGGPYVIDPTWQRSAAITRAGGGAPKH